MPPVAQAALAHAQFETIHPFTDGNGRTGRALIHVILRRRGTAPRLLPPVSLVLATWSASYIEGADRHPLPGRPTAPDAHEGINRWIALFSAACGRAVEDAVAFEAKVERIQEQWRASLGRVRTGSAVDHLVRALPGAPVVSVSGAAQLIGRSFQATNEAIHRLQAAEVLRQVNVGRRNRAFEARAILYAFTTLERQLASPTGNTMIAPTVSTRPGTTLSDLKPVQPIQSR